MKVASKILLRLHLLYHRLRRTRISRPVFVIGNGRSGTTILGKILNSHHCITYLNEPRELWESAYAITDIWSEKAKAVGGKLVLTESDTNSRQSKQLSNSFLLETIRSRRPQLVEKLPINSFRLRFINQIFPDAKYIVISRNGLEVARSIGKLDKGNTWFGEQAYKWQLLCDYARSSPTTSKLPEICDSSEEKGLLEWRLSTEASAKFLGALHTSQYIELNYSSLTQQPEIEIARLLDFLQLEHDSHILKFVKRQVARKSTKIEALILSDKQRLLGGKTLELSLTRQHLITEIIARNVTKPSE